MAAQSITVSPMLYENQERIRVNLPYDPALIQKIRTVSGARWSPKERCRHTPKTPGARACLKALFGKTAAAVKNRPGRRRDTETKVLRVSYPKLALRFLEKFFPGISDCTFKPAEDNPKGLEEAPKQTHWMIGTYKNLDTDDLHVPEVRIFNKIYLFGTLGAYMQ